MHRHTLTHMHALPHAHTLMCMFTHILMLTHMHVLALTHALTGGVFCDSSRLRRSVKPCSSVLPPVTMTLP